MLQNRKEKKNTWRDEYESTDLFYKTTAGLIKLDELLKHGLHIFTITKNITYRDGGTIKSML